MCHACPAHNRGCSGGQSYESFQPNAAELRHLIETAPPRRLLAAEVDEDTPWPIGECRLNEWFAPSGRAGFGDGCFRSAQSQSSASGVVGSTAACGGLAVWPAAAIGSCIIKPRSCIGRAFRRLRTRKNTSGGNPRLAKSASRFPGYPAWCPKMYDASVPTDPQTSPREVTMSIRDFRDACQESLNKVSPNEAQAALSFGRLVDAIAAGMSCGQWVDELRLWSLAFRICRSQQLGTIGALVECGVARGSSASRSGVGLARVWPRRVVVRHVRWPAARWPGRRAARRAVSPNTPGVAWAIWRTSGRTSRPVGRGPSCNDRVCSRMCCRSKLPQSGDCPAARRWRLVSIHGGHSRELGAARRARRLDRVRRLRALGRVSASGRRVARRGRQCVRFGRACWNHASRADRGSVARECSPLNQCLEVRSCG